MFASIRKILIYDKNNLKSLNTVQNTIDASGCGKYSGLGLFGRLELPLMILFTTVYNRKENNASKLQVVWKQYFGN